MTSRRILGLASAANEKAIKYRWSIDIGAMHEATEEHGLALADAVDALTGAIVEEANDPERKCEHGYGIKQGPCSICDAPAETVEIDLTPWVGQGGGIQNFSKGSDQ